MKALYSFLILIALLLFFFFGLPWLIDFCERHAMTLLYISAVIVFFLAWALIYAAFFSEE